MTAKEEVGTTEEMARYERNARLAFLDPYVLIPDHPKLDEIKTMRVALRDYPKHAKWPKIEPMPDPYVLGLGTTGIK